MDMIGHQAIRMKKALRVRKVTRKVKKIKAAVLLFEKAVLPIVSAVSDMNRYAGQHDPSAARHGC
jgi:hypothetical protein